MTIAALLVLAFVGTTVGATWIRVLRSGRAATPTQADAIVVFGAQVGSRGPSPELRARLEQAYALYARGLAPVVLCSGGYSGPFSEPAAMRDFLVARGVPAAAVALDVTGTSTRRTLEAVLRHRAVRGRRVLAVSSPYHMHRIAVEARRQGVDAILCPPETTPVMRVFIPRMLQELREIGAIWWYAVHPPRSSETRVAS